MTELRLRTVDAFTDQPFTGNPAAVVVLDEAPPDDWMAALAREMNLSETAFVIRAALPDADFRLRWFTVDWLTTTLPLIVAIGLAISLVVGAISETGRMGRRDDPIPINRLLA